ncbi:cysteine-rich CWC family protein [Mycoplasmatota bacterium]|nr:cysteine-rich CWC family protein [Mycoplasmatota bacterium]
MGICQICGENNKCALDQVGMKEECWCESVEFSKEMINRLKEKGITDCICRNCYSRLMESLNS